MAALPIDNHITFLSVADLDNSERFYQDGLGLPMVLDQGSCRIYRLTSTSFLGTCTHRENVSPDGIILTLVTDDVDRWYDHLVEVGIDVESPPSLNEQFQIYHLFLKDPDGHLVEIQHFTDPDWIVMVQAYAKGEDAPGAKRTFESVTYVCPECKDVLFVPGPDKIRDGIAYTTIRRCRDGRCPAWEKERETMAKRAEETTGPKRKDDGIPF